MARLLCKWMPKMWLWGLWVRNSLNKHSLLGSFLQSCWEAPGRSPKAKSRTDKKAGGQESCSRHFHGRMRMLQNGKTGAGDELPPGWGSQGAGHQQCCRVTVPEALPAPGQALLCHMGRVPRPKESKAASGAATVTSFSSQSHSITLFHPQIWFDTRGGKEANIYGFALGLCQLAAEPYARAIIISLADFLWQNRLVVPVRSAGHCLLSSHPYRYKYCHILKTVWQSLCTGWVTRWLSKDSSFIFRLECTACCNSAAPKNMCKNFECVFV